MKCKAKFKLEELERPEGSLDFDKQHLDRHDYSEKGIKTPPEGRETTSKKQVAG